MRRLFTSLFLAATLLVAPVALADGAATSPFAVGAWLADWWAGLWHDLGGHGLGDDDSPQDEYGPYIIPGGFADPGAFGEDDPPQDEFGPYILPGSLTDTGTFGEDDPPQDEYGPYIIPGG